MRVVSIFTSPDFPKMSNYSDQHSIPIPSMLPDERQGIALDASPVCCSSNRHNSLNFKGFHSAKCYNFITQTANNTSVELVNRSLGVPGSLFWERNSVRRGWQSTSSDLALDRTCSPQTDTETRWNTSVTTLRWVKSPGLTNSSHTIDSSYDNSPSRHRLENKLLWRSENGR